MAHNLVKNSQTGLYEFMSVGAAWHHLGQVVKEAQTWEQTMEMAGLDWTISKRQLSYNGIDVDAYGIFRDDIHDVGQAFLTSASETYQPIQNRFMFAFLDTMLEADGKAHYESAGALNSGAQVFALVNLATSFEIGNSGDRFENYLLFTDDRTGKKAAKCFITTVRVVCANTLEMALSRESTTDSVRFIHSKNVGQKMEDAAGLFTGARMDLSILKDKLHRLADRQIDRKTLASVLDRLFPADDEKKAASKRREDKFIEICELFADNDNNMFPETRGTGYNLLNAVTNYTDHIAPVKRTAGKTHLTDDQIRAERALFGTGATFKTSALDIILEETAFSPVKHRTYSTGSGAATQVIELEKTATTNGSGLLDAILSKGVSNN